MFLTGKKKIDPLFIPDCEGATSSVNEEQVIFEVCEAKAEENEDINQSSSIHDVDKISGETSPERSDDQDDSNEIKDEDNYEDHDGNWEEFEKVKTSTKTSIPSRNFSLTN